MKTKHIANPNHQTASTLSMKASFLCLALIPILFTGCASIIDGGPKTVHITSNPEGAKITIYDRHGKEVSVNTTPAVVALDRGGFYHWDWYRVDFEMAGYKPYEAQINPMLNPWYFGNLIFGGALGILIVDPATGDMWTIHPRNISCNLVPVPQALAPERFKTASAKEN
jgi:hypothetical protein